jgi:hypothetical protein
MGDLALRISLLVQRGYICQSCGDQIDGELHHAPRRCQRCEIIYMKDGQLSLKPSPTALPSIESASTNGPAKATGS